MNDLDVHTLSFSYGDGDTLENISFDARPGEVVGIIGQNGCGKTTLLKCINASLRPRDGAVMVDGEDVLEMKRKDIARNIGVVSQSSTIVFPYNVLDMVLMGRYPVKGRFDPDSSDEDLKIVYGAMEDTEVLNFSDRDIDELSGGERQRVLIARALAQEPKILLMDEPTLHLDVNHQFDLMELIKKLSREKNMLVVVVTHDIMLAARYCDRVVLMTGGKIFDIGQTKDVLTGENLAEVFEIEAEVTHSERINGLNVFIIGRSKREDERPDRNSNPGRSLDRAS